MKKNHSLKRSLLASLLSLILCFAMLLGSTFAWFTDSVSSEKNTIVAGNLDIELEYKKVTSGVIDTDWSPVVGKSDIFDPNALWEPGRLEVVYLKVSNLGSLALKYELSVDTYDETIGLNAAGEVLKLSDHLVFEVFEMDDALTVYTEDELRALIGSAQKGVDDYNGATKTLEPKDAANDEDYLALVVYMPKEVGNEANYRGAAVPTIALGINLVATQYTAESDSFGPDYDADAEYPQIVAFTKTDAINEAQKLTIGKVSATIPANAPAGFYELAVNDFGVMPNVGGGETAVANVSLTKDGVAVESGAAIFEVETEISMMADISSLSYNGKILDKSEYEYDVFTGAVTVESNTVGSLSISYDVFGTEVELDTNPATGKPEIQSGTFTKNPALIDTSLNNVNNNANDPRMVVDYDKNAAATASQSSMLLLSSTRAVQDMVYYVSDKDSTVVVGHNANAAAYGLDKDGNYEFENGNVKVTLVNDNALYTITKAPNKTIYILPGTYNEETTITVASSMDIIGLGNKENILIKKGAGASNSNRHLFNCSGAFDVSKDKNATYSDSDYIHVTIRNLTLDAQEMTSNGKDNAAVQAIRLAKVKCYDLKVIKKTTDAAAVALYVNNSSYTLNNEPNGKKINGPGAYMYVENCELEVREYDFNVVSTSSSAYKFFYNNLTFKSGKVYTKNSSYIKNQEMAWDDWDWLN